MHLVLNGLALRTNKGQIVRCVHIFCRNIESAEFRKANLHTKIVTRTEVGTKINIFM